MTSRANPRPRCAPCNPTTATATTAATAGTRLKADHRSNDTIDARKNVGMRSGSTCPIVASRQPVRPWLRDYVAGTADVEVELGRSGHSESGGGRHRGGQAYSRG